LLNETTGAFDGFEPTTDPLQVICTTLPLQYFYCKYIFYNWEVQFYVSMMWLMLFQLLAYLFKILEVIFHLNSSGFPAKTHLKFLHSLNGLFFLCTRDEVSYTQQRMCYL